MPTGLSSKTPWFSWMGGPHLKETPNVGVWDSVAWLHLGYGLGKVGYLCHPTSRPRPRHPCNLPILCMHASSFTSAASLPKESCAGSCRIFFGKMKGKRGEEHPWLPEKCGVFGMLLQTIVFLLGSWRGLVTNFTIDIIWYILAAACSTGPLLYSVYTVPYSQLMFSLHYGEFVDG